MSISCFDFVFFNTAFPVARYLVFYFQLIPLSFLVLARTVSFIRPLFLSCVSTAIKAHKKPYADDSKRNAAVAVGFVDSLVWQAFASVIVPGFTINRVCAGSLWTMEKVRERENGIY